MFSRPHWSYSQISQFLRCPLQYYFERVLRLRRTSISSGLAFGSTIHETLARIHMAIQAGHAVGPVYAGDAFSGLWRQKLASEPVQLRANESATDLENLGVALLSEYVKGDLPRTILAIEASFVVPLVTSQGEVLEKPLVAVIDLLSSDESGLVVNEFKTSSRRYSQQEVESAMQAATYAHVVAEKFGGNPRVRYTVFVKTKTPVIQRLDTDREPADFQRLADIVHTVERAIQAQAFYPNENPVNCSGCPFVEPCREWKGPRLDLDSEVAPALPNEVVHAG